jgi:hypothetical protein
MTFDYGGIGPPMVNPSHRSNETHIALSTKINEFWITGESTVVTRKGKVITKMGVKNGWVGQDLV